ncbi:MAG: hypothetical protein R3A44_32750 [Caldilineaceae bacterium]
MAKNPCESAQSAYKISFSDSLLGCSNKAATTAPAAVQRSLRYLNGLIGRLNLRLVIENTYGIFNQKSTNFNRLQEITMAITPQTVALSDIHKSFSDVKAKIDRGPVLVLRNNEATAWMVSPEQWDAMQRAIQAYSQMLEQASRGKPTVTLSELFERAGVDPEKYEAVPV